MKRFYAVFLSVVLGWLSLSNGAEPLKFTFYSGKTSIGFTKISIKDTFDVQRGYGFEPQVLLTDLNKKSTGSRTFSVLLDEGNYKVTATFGGVESDTNTTLKCEDRRVLVSPIKTAPSQITTVEFTINIRTPILDGGGLIKLNSRETGPGCRRWDGKLSLEILGPQPALRSLEIARHDKAITVFLAGDSTVTEQPAEPYAGWGQMLPLCFGPGVAIANHAESGRALDSFRREHRWEKILQSLKPGDYVFIQFGHNDQKEKTPGSGPFTTYRDRLKEYVADVRARKGLPVIVTPMERRRFRDGKTYPTLHEFAQAAREVAFSEKVPLIDLHPMSLQLYEALGPEDSRKAFVHYPAGSFPGQEKKLEDDTHHNAYGGLQLAKCILEGIRKTLPELSQHLRPGLPAYNPSQPDRPEDFAIPPSPTASPEKPAGN